MRKKIILATMLAILGSAAGGTVLAREDYFRPASSEIITALPGLERVVATSEGGLNLYQNSGDLAPGYPLFVNGAVIASAPLLADVASTTEKEIIFITRDDVDVYTLQVFSGDKTLLAAAALPVGVYYDLAELKTPGQSKRDILLATIDGKIYSYRYTNGVLNKTFIVDAGQVAGVAAVGDGSQFIVNYPDALKLDVYNRAGDGWVFFKKIDIDQSWLYPALYASSSPTIIYGVAKDKLNAININTGAPILGFPAVLPSAPADSPYLADLGGGQQLVAPLLNGQGAIYNLNGNLIKNDFAKKSFLESSTLAPEASGGVFSAAADYAGRIYSVVTDTVASWFSRLKFAILNVVASPSLVLEYTASTTMSVANGGTYDFGQTVTIGSSTTRQFVVKNEGVVDLKLSGSPPVAITGVSASEFSIVQQPLAVILPGATSTLIVRFAPQSQGAKNAQLEILSNDSENNPFIVHLSARGFDPDATLYENAEDNLTTRWRINNPNGPTGTIANVPDDVEHSRAIEIKVADVNNQNFWLYDADGTSPWKNTKAKNLQFDFKTKDEAQFYARVETNLGTYYIMYSFDYPKTGLVFGNYVSIHLDPALKDGVWHTVVRDLEADLKSVNPALALNRVDNFIMGSGSARVDNVELLTTAAIFSITGKILDNNSQPLSGITVRVTPGIQSVITNANGEFSLASLPNGNYVVTPEHTDYIFTPTSTAVIINNAATSTNFTGALNTSFIYENAEDGLTTRWRINNPNGPTGTIANVPDDVEHSRAIEIKVADVNNQNFWLYDADGTSPWKNTKAKNLQFDFKTKDEAQFYARVETNLGTYYIMYSFAYPRTGLIDGNYVSIHLDPALKDGAWHTVARDLEADLKSVNPALALNRVDNFIMGSGSARVDNVELLR